MKNIQEPVKIDIRQLVDRFGSHYVNFKIGNSSNPYHFGLYEQIGYKDKLNHWDHQFDTKEQAIDSIKNKFTILANKMSESYKNKTSGFLNSVLYAFISDYRNELKELKKTEFEYRNNALKLPSDFTDESLNGFYSIPKYMPEENVDYFFMSFSHNKAKVTKMRLVDSSIYDYRGAKSYSHEIDQYDFHFGFSFENPDNENDSLYLDFERLIKFDGQKWETSISGGFLFLNEKDAYDTAVEMSQRTIDKLQSQIKELEDLQVVFSKKN